MSIFQEIGGWKKMKILVIVPCGKSKIWDKQPAIRSVKAEAAYTGAPFKANRDFAKKFADRWVILSAKYGFIDPDFIIPENYNVTFNDPSTNPISLEKLKAQVEAKKLAQYDLVISLGGKEYTRRVKVCFAGKVRVISPVEGLPVGKAMGFIKNLTALEKPEMLNKISSIG